VLDRALRPEAQDLQTRVTNQAVDQVALSRAWVWDGLMRHAQVYLGEIPRRVKMRKAHSTDVVGYGGTRRAGHALQGDSQAKWQATTTTRPKVAMRRYRGALLKRGSSESRPV
jgi:hypothetical protein